MKDKFKKFDAKNYIGEILTGFIILALITYLFVGIGIKDSLDENFWTLFGIGFAIMVAITSVWYPNAKQKAKLHDKNFKNQRLEYSILVDRVVKTGNFKGLKKFCEFATEENKQQHIKTILAKINIDYDIYKKYLKNIPGIEKDTQLDKKQKRKLKKLIIKGVRFSHINPSKITTAIESIKEQYDVKSEEQSYDRKTLIAKILTSILTTLGFAFIAFSGQGFTLAKLAQIMSWFVLIAWNICTSISSGAKSITLYRANYYKKLRNFLNEFCVSEYYDNTVAWTRPDVQEEDEAQELGEAFIKKLKSMFDESEKKKKKTDDE